MIRRIPLRVASYVPVHARELALDVDVYLGCVQDAGGGRVTVQFRQNVEHLGIAGGV